MKSRAPLLALTLFVSDLDRSTAFFTALGFHCEPCPEDRGRAVEVVVGNIHAPLLQLFTANDTCPPTRCQLVFQVPDMVPVAKALDAHRFDWDCRRFSSLVTRDPDGNRVVLHELDSHEETFT